MAPGYTPGGIPSPAPARPDGNAGEPSCEEIAILIFQLSRRSAAISHVRKAPFSGIETEDARGLGTEGQKLWTSVVDEFDLSAEPHKRRILFDVCKTADVIKRLDDVASKQPVTVKGSMGQEVIHPCIAQAQTARVQLTQMLARLNFAGMEDD